MEASPPFHAFQSFCPVSRKTALQENFVPLAPEYIGYADSGLCEHFFVSQKPAIELIGEHQFKYHVDFDALEITKEIAAICVSRPTNPTGNVTDRSGDPSAGCAGQKV